VIAFHFRKSSYSGGEPHAECVEVALNNPAIVAVRDSKKPGAAVLYFAPAAWAEFSSRIVRPPMNADNHRSHASMRIPNTEGYT
jgi:hypothetical protein